MNYERWIVMNLSKEKIENLSDRDLDILFEICRHRNEVTITEVMIKEEIDKREGEYFYHGK